MPEFTLNLIPIFLFLLLGGCASIYKNPDSGIPTAQVRFASHEYPGMYRGQLNVDIYIYNSNEDFCSSKIERSQLVASLNGMAIVSHRNDLSLPLGENYPKESKTEVSVKADEPLIYAIGYIKPDVYLATGYVQGFTGSSACMVGAKFTPEANHLYEVTYEIKDDRCFSKVVEIAKNEAIGYERIAGPLVQGVKCN